MARTRRKYMTEGNYREARRGRATVRRAQAATAAIPGPRTACTWNRDRAIEAAIIGAEWGHHNVHGGMLMSPSNTGFWWDDTLNDRDKRQIKRSERQRVAREVATPEADALDSVWTVRRAADDLAGLPGHVDDVYYPPGFDPSCLSCGRYCCVCHMIEGEDY